jgi:hypothetical protein
MTGLPRQAKKQTISNISHPAMIAQMGFAVK